MISGVCLVDRNEEEMKEFDNLLSVGVPRNPMVGDVKLLYMSIDCLEH